MADWDLRDEIAEIVLAYRDSDKYSGCDPEDAADDILDLIGRCAVGEPISKVEID